MFTKELDTQKIIFYSKNALFPIAILFVFLMYFFSIEQKNDGAYHFLHNAFLIVSSLTMLVGMYFKVVGSVMSTLAVYIAYIVINNTKYMYGEDYIFSSSYNIWIIMVVPTIYLINYFSKFSLLKKHWSLLLIFLFLETSLTEALQTQAIDVDYVFFYKHIGAMNYLSFYVSLFCIFLLLVNYISKGYILTIKALFSSLSIMFGIYFSNNLEAYSLFFLASSIIECVVTIYYVFFIKYKDETLNISNINMFFKDAEKKYPPKYSIILLYLDDYERILKRFGKQKMVILKKMFFKKVKKTAPDVKIYNYQDDALIISCLNLKTNECFEKAEEIRRAIATSIFIFNENNHLQLTVSQCVSEKKRSDINTEVVLTRAETALKKACKFTRNITVKA